MTRCGNWVLQKSKKVDFTTRCGNWGPLSRESKNKKIQKTNNKTTTYKHDKKKYKHDSLW